MSRQTRQCGRDNEEEDYWRNEGFVHDYYIKVGSRKLKRLAKMDYRIVHTLKTMEIGIKNRFYVVEFVDPPYRDFDQYICIPVSWVIMHEPNTELVLIKYPVEEPSKTKQRIKDYDVSSIDWSYYKTNFKYCTGSYEEAEKYIKILENRVIMERNYPEITKKCDNGNLSSITINDDSQTVLLNDDVESASEQIPLNNSIHPSKAKSNTKQLQQSIIKPKLNRSRTPKIRFKKSNNVDRSKINHIPGGKTGNESLIDDHTSESANKSFHSKIIRKPISGSDSLNMMKVVNRTPLTAQWMATNNNFAARHFDSIATPSKGMAARHSDSISNGTASKDKVASEVQEKERHKESEKEKKVADITQTQTEVLKGKEAASDEREDDDDNEDFFEYNANNLNWTLKYHKLSPEVVELTEGSGIYVNAAKLIKHQRSTTDSKNLARCLLLEIFSDIALRTCLFTSSINSNGMIRRPGLDEHAKTVLLDYVEKYAQDNNWPKVDRESITASIRTKLYNRERKRNRE